MPNFPSSQSKVKKTSLENQIKAAMARIPHRHLTLYGKVSKLRQTISDDPIQQLQSEIISELYDAVRALQVDLFPILLTLPQLAWAED
jgi:hypothetical protein